MDGLAGQLAGVLDLPLNVVSSALDAIADGKVGAVPSALLDTVASTVSSVPVVGGTVGGVVSTVGGTVSGLASNPSTYQQHLPVKQPKLNYAINSHNRRVLGLDIHCDRDGRIHDHNLLHLSLRGGLAPLLL